MPEGTLRAILQQAGIEPEEFLDTHKPKHRSCRRAYFWNSWQAMGLRLIEGVTRWVRGN
jgi:hypothetical protein